MIHLSIPVRDVASTLTFYRDLLGCSASRVQPDRVDFEFFGHHLVAQLSPAEAAHRSVHIGDDNYPLRHFGVIVEPAVPYKGGAPALVELMGGHVPLLFSSLAESGFPGFDASIWFGIVGPAGLQPAVMDKLVPALSAVMRDPAVQEAIRKEGYDPMLFTPAQMRVQMTQDLTQWGKTVKEANVKME